MGGFIGVMKGKDWLIIIYAAFLVIVTLLEFLIIGYSGGDPATIILSLIYVMIMMMIFYNTIKYYRLTKGLQDYEIVNIMRNRPINYVPPVP